MAWSPYHLAVAVLMVVTGTINTLSMKWADKLESVGRDGKSRIFDHPFVQTCFMFAGELLCLIVFKILICYLVYRPAIPRENNFTQGNQEFNPLIFLPPALLDMVATSIMYVGLNLTNASSFQMLRGSVIVFTEILSMAFLEKKFCGRRWIGILVVLGGLCCVGFADFALARSTTPTDGKKTDLNAIITGDLLIVIAQIISASQMVYEEKFTVAKDVPPLQAVGWEGLFGMVGILLLLIPLNFIHIPPPFQHTIDGTVEDVPDAIAQIGNNMFIVIALLGTMTSIAFFNFAGISMSKAKSATTRMVLDSLRTFFIWICSLALGWQQFQYLQVIGFVLLVLGMLIYNNILPSIESIRRRSDRRFGTVLVDNQPADEP